MVKKAPKRLHFICVHRRATVELVCASLSGSVLKNCCPVEYMHTIGQMSHSLERTKNRAFRISCPDYPKNLKRLILLTTTDLSNECSYAFNSTFHV